MDAQDVLNELLTGPDGQALDQEITDRTVEWIRDRARAHSNGFESEYRQEQEDSTDTHYVLPEAIAWEDGFLYAWNLAHAYLADYIEDNGWVSTCGGLGGV